MSYQAVTWALRQPVQHSPAKFVLVALAHFHQADRATGEPMRAWASVSTLATATGQDRKTVLANLQRLIAMGHLVDTGEREGQTKSVAVYLLTEPDSSPKTGTASTPGSSTNFPYQAVPNSDPLSGTETGTASASEAVPVSTRSSTSFSGKQYQKPPEAVPVFPTEEVEKEKKEKGEKDIARRARAKTRLPDGFGISARVQAWANERGYDNLPAHLDHFIGCALARGYTYADWDQAFMNAIRADWARLRQPPRAVASRQAIAERNHQEFLRLTGGGAPDDGRTIDMEVA